MVSRLIVVSNLYPPTVVGGAEIVAFSEASGLAKHGLDVAVLAGTFLGAGRDPGSIDVDEMDGVPVYRVHLPALDYNDNFYKPATQRYLRALIEAHQAECIHFHNVYGLGANLIPAAKELGLKVVVTLHDHWGFCFKGTLKRNDGRVCRNPQECALCDPWVRPENGAPLPIRLRRDYVAWCLEQADLLISPSEYLAGAYRAAGITAPIERLSYGVNLKEVPANAKSKSSVMRFVCLAYIGEHKGIPVLLDAAESLARDNTLSGRWSLTIAGPGHLATKLETDIAAGRFAGAVDYKGQLSRPDAIEIINSSDVLILPSVWPENEPVTLLEAIASGTAQLASRIGGILDLVEDGKSGLLFEPGDVNELTDKMRRYILNPALASEHGAWNRDRRAEFDEVRTLSRLQQLYCQESLPHSREQQVVICAGEGSAKEIALSLQRFHVIEEGRFNVRFIWHEWADAAVWCQARLLWVWGGATPYPVLSRALGRGLPILAPRGSFPQQLERVSTAVVGYETYLEGLAALAALIGSNLRDQAGTLPAPAVARLIATIAPRESFHLANGVPA